MSLKEFRDTAADLQRDKEHHIEKAGYYHRAFNRHIPAAVPDTIGYTPMQVFYQAMAQFHLQNVFEIERMFADLTDIANDATLDCDKDIYQGSGEYDNLLT